MLIDWNVTRRKSGKKSSTHAKTTKLSSVSIRWKIYSNVKNLSRRRRTQQVNHRARMNLEQCWVWHYSVIVVSLAVINVTRFFQFFCSLFRLQTSKRVSLPFCFNPEDPASVPFRVVFFSLSHPFCCPRCFTYCFHTLLCRSKQQRVFVRPRRVCGWATCVKSFNGMEKVLAQISNCFNIRANLLDN